MNFLNDLADRFSLNDRDVLNIRNRLIVHPHLNESENDMEFIGEVVVVGAH